MENDDDGEEDTTKNTKDDDEYDESFDYDSDDNSENENQHVPKKPHRGDWYFFEPDHPQSQSHRVRILPEAKAFVPNFKGKVLPRRDKGNREDYCMTMLTLFKAWRDPKELKANDQLWDEAFAQHSFTSRQDEIMKFFHLRYECNDARDDYAAQLKAVILSGADLPVALDQGTLLNSTDTAYYGNESLADIDDDDMDEMAIDYGMSSKQDLDMLKKMDNAERLMNMSGALNPIQVKPLNISREDGNKHSGQHWHESLLELKQQILQHRSDQAHESKEREKAEGLLNNKHPDEIKVIDQSFFQKKFAPPDEDAQALITATVKQFQLNDEQERAFRIIANHACLKQPEQLKMYLGGMAGTGKSQVIKALTHFFAERNEEY